MVRNRMVLWLLFCSRAAKMRLPVTESDTRLVSAARL